jgi:hypothetical protein
MAPISRRGIAAALGLALPLVGCGVVAREARKEATGMVSPPPADMARARDAWSYFEPGDAIRPAVAGSSFTTPSALGDQLAATIAAFRMGLIDRRAFDSRIARLLRFLDVAPLSGGVLPGRYYDLQTGRLTTPPTLDADPGWSASQIGRLLVWLRILAEEQPPLATLIGQIVARWSLCRALGPAGRPLTAFPAGGKLYESEELGGGYGLYALQGFAAWGVRIPPEPAWNDEASIRVEGLTVPLPIGGKAEPLMTAPLALLGVEFGWVGPAGAPLEASRRWADLALEAQRRRFRRARILTARSDYLRSSDPYLVYGTVMSAGYPWTTTDGGGAPHPELALLSTRAAYGDWALRPLDPHAQRLLKAVDPLRAPGGFAEGRYEHGGKEEPTRTAATNAFVLETLLYRRAGPLYPGAARARSGAGRMDFGAMPACDVSGAKHP